MKRYLLVYALMWLPLLGQSSSFIIPLEVIHNHLFDFYLPENSFLTESEHQQRIHWRSALWQSIKNNEEIIQLLSVLQPNSSFFPEDIKQAFSDLFTQDVSQIDPQRLEEFRWTLRRHPDNNVRKFAASLRKIYSYLDYAGPLTQQISGVAAAEQKIYDREIVLPASRLMYHQGSITHQDGAIDYLIIGSGPAGSLIASELTRLKPDAKIVLIESGSFVKSSVVNTESASELMESLNQRTNVTGGIAFRNGNTVGGGTTINLDLAFSPLLPQIQNNIQEWIDHGLVDAHLFHSNDHDWQKMKAAYDWVSTKLGTRKVEYDEMNRNNFLLLSAAPQATTYALNQKRAQTSSSPILKTSAVDAFLLPALLGNGHKSNLSLISDAKVSRLIFNDAYQACGAIVEFQKPLNKPYVLQSHNFNTKPGDKAFIKAKNIIVCAGALGSAELLLRSNIANNNIGKGIVIHPSIGIVAEFDHEIDATTGLSAAVYAPSDSKENKYFFESMSAEPAFVALLYPGSGTQIFNAITKVKNLGGFGIMLIDSVSAENKIYIDPLTNNVEIAYELNPHDKSRLREALKKGINMLFDQGAQQIYLPTCEPILSYNKLEYIPITSRDQVDKAIDRLQFIENQNFISSAHLQSSNKMGNNPLTSVVSHNFRVWNQITKKEIPNLYVVDGSIFPTSVGANPMQSIYTIAKLFIDHINY
ncbi:MAG: GMC oxidoreductase [Candidatus Dependentiae bacterium]|nr:GMC oxidoreductase [Candidatus Dependentiae bacterium]